MIILLVDDEFPARQELRFVLEQLLPEATFYEASDGDEALAVIAKLNTDVVFLDISMPGMNGLSVANAIMDSPNSPLIVFATAYDQHALKAFELAAIDYVVKPFSKRRLTKTATQIRQRLGEKNTLSQQKVVFQQFLSKNSTTKNLKKLWVERENGSRLFLSYDEIRYIEAKEKRVYVSTRDGKQWRTRYTLKELERRLTEHDFCRVHKGFLVNINEIAEIIPWFSGGYQIKLKDEAASTIPISRRYAPHLKKRVSW